MKKPKPGTVAWHDLTCRDAVRLRDFYSAIAGWKSIGVDMGGYEDFAMAPTGSRTPVAGVCHRRGVNKSIPKGWMMYIQVSDFDLALKTIKKNRGKQIGKTRTMGDLRFAYVKDPEGNPFAIGG